MRLRRLRSICRLVAPEASDLCERAPHPWIALMTDSETLGLMEAVVVGSQAAALSAEP